MNWFTEVDKTLDAISKLEPGWDSYDASAISPGAIARARFLLLNLSILLPGKPYINPTRNGGIQIEYDVVDIYIEWVINDSDMVEYLYEYENYEKSGTIGMKYVIEVCYAMAK